jgi:two-component system response regulator RegX3
LKYVWNYEASVETRTVDVFVSKIRKYVEKNPSHPKYLISVRGVGYQYNPAKAT